MADAFAENFRLGLEVGAACAVVVDGDLVVDLWDGMAQRGRPWTGTTLIETRSATKGVAALCMHMLIDRGLVGLDTAVRHYWPQLRADPTIRHVLSHSAGIPVIDRSLPPGGLVDWDVMADAVAAQEPLWEPGSKFGYHGVTFGWLIGDVIRRASGFSIGAFVRREIAPLVGGDCFIGTPASEHHRIAPMTPSPAASAAPSVAAPASPNAGYDLASRMYAPMYPPVSPPWNSPKFWEAEIPVANGMCTARALATIYGQLASGGDRLVSPDAVTLMRGRVFSGPDQVLGRPVRRSLGFELTPVWTDDGRPPDAFGHPGAGGFEAFADTTAGVGFAYVKNAGPALVGQPDQHAGRIITALYSCL